MPLYSHTRMNMDFLRRHRVADNGTVQCVMLASWYTVKILCGKAANFYSKGLQHFSGQGPLSREREMRQGPPQPLVPYG